MIYCNITLYGGDKMKNELKLVAGCDTFEVRADYDLTQDYGGITHLQVLNECKSHGRLWKYKVTCDKISSGYNMADFSGIIDYVREVFKGATVLYISRLDIRFDNFDIGAYETYYKLNSLLLSLLAYRYTFANRYASTDPIVGIKKTIRVERKAGDYTAEYYNKQAQKPERGISARLELRSKRTEIDLLQDISGFTSFHIGEWFDMMSEAANKERFNELKQQINCGITDNYIEGKFKSAAEYVAYYSDFIYDKQQARDIFVRLGKSGRNGDDFFANRPQQQIITLDDIRAYIGILRAASIKFLDVNKEQVF